GVPHPVLLDRFVEIVQNFRRRRNRLAPPGVKVVAIGIEVTVGANPRKAKHVPCPAKGVTPFQEEKRFVRAALPEVTSATDTGEGCSDDQDFDLRMRCCVHHYLATVHANGLSYKHCRSMYQTL